MASDIRFPFEVTELTLCSYFDAGRASLLSRLRQSRLPVGWQVQSLRVESGYAAAVAATGSEWRTVQHDNRWIAGELH
jgi:hypothetical protein